MYLNEPLHGSTLEGSDPHELAGGFEVCQQMKGTHIGASELTLFKSYEIGLWRIRPICFWLIKSSPKFYKAIKKISKIKKNPLDYNFFILDQ